MSIDVFNYVDLCIKLVGLVVIVFGGGKYFGTINQVLKDLKEEISQHKKQFDAHLANDLQNLKEITTGINEVKVQIAGIRNEK